MLPLAPKPVDDAALSDTLNRLAALSRDPNGV
jgi:hypothetical protein